MKYSILMILWSFQLLAIDLPVGLPNIPWPDDNAYTKQKAELGKLLYFDKRLSSDRTVSCASCHAVEKAFTDHNPVSIGISGNKGSRNAPTIINSAYLKHLFWDGRATSIEDQCKAPLANLNEMTTWDNAHLAHVKCHERIQKIEGYRVLFKKVFGTEECTIENVAKAIATFERTVLSGNAPFDRYKAGDKNAMTNEQIMGYRIFIQKGCGNCHAGPLFSDGRFLNIGIGMESINPDLGRYNVTQVEKDWGAFKVPTLREVSKTFPYMHDGSLKTLEDVIDYYDKGGTPNRNLHPLMRPLNLTADEKKALVSFLRALEGEGWQHIKQPCDIEFPDCK